MLICIGDRIRDSLINDANDNYLYWSDIKYKKVRIDKDAPWKDVTKLKYIEELTKILDV